MTTEEKKEYILKNWNIGSGKRLAEMIRRYWKDKHAKKDTYPAQSANDAHKNGHAYKVAKEVFSN